MICWHKFGKWSAAFEGYSGGSIHQVCMCEKCGAIKRRTAISGFKALVHANVINSVLGLVK